MNFPEQHKLIAPIFKHDQIAGGFIDQGAQGRALADSMYDEFGYLCVPLGMGQKNKGEMAELLRAFAQSERITFPKDDPFHSLEAKDGFRVSMIQAGPSMDLICEAYAGGVPQPITHQDGTVTAYVSFFPFLHDIAIGPILTGRITRTHLLAEAVARFLNTGGSWAEVKDLMMRMMRVATGGIVLDGYYLHDSYLTTEGVFQHVFAAKDKSGRAALWEEPRPGDHGTPVGGFIDYTTLETLAAQEESDAAGEETGEAEDAADGLPHPLQLPAGRDIHPPEAPNGDTHARDAGEDADG